MCWRPCCQASVEVNNHLNNGGCWVVHDDDSKAVVLPRFASQVVVQLGIDTLGHGTWVGEDPSPTSVGEKHLGHVSQLMVLPEAPGAGSEPRPTTQTLPAATQHCLPLFLPLSLSLSLSCSPSLCLSLFPLYFLDDPYIKITKSQEPH